MDANRINLVKLFIDECKENPTILSDPSLSFFTDYLESLGAEVPGKARAAAGQMNDFDDESDDDMPELEKNSAPKYAGPNISEMDESDDEQIDESDVELDDEGVVEPDNDPPQEMGDSSVEVTEEKRDEAQVYKGQAMEALSEGDFTEALKHLTEAILCNPASAIIYASRASVYLKMKKPNAAIRDADAALKINPDSAKGYKTRGMAKALLGQWEEAAKDLHVASRLDYDEEIAAVLKKVEPNAHKIEEHKRKYERLRKQRDEKKEKRERQRKRAEAQAAYERAKQEEQSSSGKKSGGMPGGFPGGMPGGFPGGMPGGFPGGMPGGFPGGKPAGGSPGGSPGGMPGGSPGGMPDMSKILNDPEMMAAFSDPEILAALQDVMKDPANLAKHQSNPKIAPVIAKMMGKFGGT